MTAMTLHDLVAHTARRHPAATALVVAHEPDLTYAQLIDAAEATASTLLQAAGTGNSFPPRVGLIGHKTTATYTAYLALLRLGATVVPLSTAAPTARVRAICEAANLSLLVADAAGAATLAPLAETPNAPRVIAIDALPTAPARTQVPPQRREQPTTAHPADPVAYVIFTSGTTGRPKGVPITHGNALACVRHNIDAYGIGVGDRLTQTFDFAFDPSVFDMFVAWGSGATLVAPTPNDLLHPVAWVRREAITHWFSVPSTIATAAKLGELTEASMPTLKVSMFGGEPLTADHARAWHGAAPQSKLENLYGPTECTISVSSHSLADDPRHWPQTDNGTLPIGRVYDHMERVVVADGREAEQGELCLRGSQRFAGYLDPQDNTGRYYVREQDTYLPLADDALPTAQAWYRTGDRVAYTPDGDLVHLGRLDSQVKIRGFRIELSEIEGALRLAEPVQDAVVVAAPGRAGHLELTAFYTGRTADPRTLRTALAASLPAYMVPRRITHLDAFPLTTNGKVDRARLLNHT
ncbi:amino acid adenylation domain-containing protein [Streptomyces sp. NPDC007205]|uniref:amino acid adenylation domain-containing protein n=1 Tax=Streptomyces sp. NPDC007205 TaxID=3154316 RepID=UPI0033D8530D